MRHAPCCAFCLTKTSRRPSAGLIAGHHVSTAYEMGWAGIANGVLISTAEADGFDVLVTADRNISYQRNLTGRRLSLIVLSTNIWATIRANPDPILLAPGGIQPGGYSEVALERPRLRRRPYVPPPGQDEGKT